MLETATTDAEKTVVNEAIIGRFLSRARENQTANRLLVPDPSPVEVHYPLPSQIPTGFHGNPSGGSAYIHSIAVWRPVKRG